MRMLLVLICFGFGTIQMMDEAEARREAQWEAALVETSRKNAADAQAEAEQTEAFKPAELDVRLISVEPDAATSDETLEDLESKLESDVKPCGRGGFVDSKEKRELELLAIACYREAGGDECCNLCRYRVCDVALTRRDDPRYPDTLEGVLTEPLQYGLLSITGVVWPERASDPEEAEAVARAWEVAEDVLSGNHSDLWGKGYIFQAEFPQGDLDGRIYCEQCNMWYGKG